MAGREGPRARGTDGSDFGHRETVASHYQISVINKRRLKTTLVFHFVLFLYEIIKLSTEILESINVDWRKIHNVTLPEPVIWEWCWICCIIFVPFAYLATKKNNAWAMKLFVVGIFGFGILPLLGAIMYLSGDLRVYLLLGSSDDSVKKFNGVPLVLISSIFVTMAFLTHSLSIVFAKNLIDAWSTKKGKTN